MSTASATVQAAVRSDDRTVDAWNPRGLWPLGLPWLMLLAAAAIGFGWTLNLTVARERLLGLAVSGLLAIAALRGLQALPRSAPALVAAAIVSLLGGAWVIAASGPDVFRGSVGRVLQLVCAPLFGRVQVADPIEIANTRFIIGYNGLADLCAVAIFCCGGVLLERWRAPRRTDAAPWSVIVVATVVLIGTGARGGLTGLAAGTCAVGLIVWPRRYAVLAIVVAPVALAAATLGIVDKGLEFTSTAGRLNYWADLTRLLTEYPLTGVGLGVDTAYRATLRYEINPDPERLFYAHNTFVQTYLEMGPLGTLAMLLVPLTVALAALYARRYGSAPGRRSVVIAGTGVAAAMTAHGLTDQVVTTTVGTCLLLLATSAVLAGLEPLALGRVARLMQRLTVAVIALAALVIGACLIVPPVRAQALLDIGGLKLAQALALDTQAPGRAAALADTEKTLTDALALAPTHPAILRELAWARSAQYDDVGALDAIRRAAEAPRLDAFDRLQIAHLYREMGFAREAYDLAAQAYAATGRSTEDIVLQTYAQSTLAALDDFRARTLAEQGEAAMHARRFGQAEDLFAQALAFQPDSPYLQDRRSAAGRAVAKYGP